MTNREVAVENIRRVARRLGDLRERAVFLGGSITGLLITDPASPDTRPTKDVDIAVITTSLSDTSRLDEELRTLGFQHSIQPGAPTCRWVIEDCLVDVMPVGLGANAYHDLWTPPAIENAVSVDIGEDIRIRHVAAPYFVAIKVETFADRGAGDYLRSPDIDDIIQVLDGRPELYDEITRSAPDVRAFISKEFGALLENDQFLDSISAHLLPDMASQARESIILVRLHKIASAAPNNS